VYTLIATDPDWIDPMSPSPHTVLLAVVDAVEASGEPVPRGELADSLGVPEATLSEPLAALSECELLEATGGGYRPTVTTHELLARDIDAEDVLVVDIVEE
jgi:DNA-binding IclR family transcriptional regulator